MHLRGPFDPFFDKKPETCARVPLFMDGKISIILYNHCTWIFNPLAASGRRKPKSLSRHLNRYLLVHHFRRQFSLHIIKGYFILHLSSILSTSRVCRNTFFRLGSLKSTLMSSLGTPITPARDCMQVEMHISFQCRYLLF